MIEVFDNRELASQEAATAIAAALRRRLEAQGTASLVVSGGTTPVRCFEHLRGADIDWAGVSLTLSDERCVPAQHADSNARLVREHLLRDRAEKASFFPLFDATKDAALSEQSLRMLPIPFAGVLLGMGVDGHFASLFPDAPELDTGLDADASRLLLPISTNASPHPRITLTLAALSRSDSIILLIFGEEKRHVVERAQGDTGSAGGLPIAYLLRQKRAPLRVIWAP